MDILDILKEDHEKVLDLLDKLEQTTERAAKSRQQEYSKLKKELLQHMHGEETVFYPFLLENAEDRELALEAIEEHQAVKMAMPGLESTDPGDEHWKPKCKVMAEMIRHHIEEEEDEIFEQAEELMDDQTSARIAKEFQQAKKEAEIQV
jgi:hemerythrin-like domain-containing protein